MADIKFNGKLYTNIGRIMIRNTVDADMAVMELVPKNSKGQDVYSQRIPVNKPMLVDVQGKIGFLSQQYNSLVTVIGNVEQASVLEDARIIGKFESADRYNNGIGKCNNKISYSYALQEKLINTSVRRQVIQINGQLGGFVVNYVPLVTQYIVRGDVLDAVCCELRVNGYLHYADVRGGVYYTKK
jgi:hypothetical protein